MARFASVHAVSVDLHVGSRLPASAPAAGRAILSRLDPAEAQARLKSARRSAMTARTVTDLAGLRALLERAREDGYALNDQEAFVGDISVAAPLLDTHGQPVGAINIAVPSPRWQLNDVLARLVPALLKTAAAVNREIRFSESCAVARARPQRGAATSAHLGTRVEAPAGSHTRARPRRDTCTCSCRSPAANTAATTGLACRRPALAPAATARESRRGGPRPARSSVGRRWPG
ncbi:MAG: IclR family transcriptional regulator C-terminal domain-containing protein [Rubrivivax sp.]